MLKPEITGEGLVAVERLATDIAQRAGSILRASAFDQAKIAAAEPAALNIARRLAENSHLETTFRERPIIYSAFERSTEQRAGSRTGNIIDDKGKSWAVFERRFTADRREKEQAVYRIHAISPFTNHFPVTVETADGRVIQERVGKSLLDQGTKFDQMFLGNKVKWGQDPRSMEWLYQSHPEFRDQLQQTVAERLAIDLNDLGYHNIGMTARDGHLLMANLDAAHPFGDRWEARVPAMVPVLVGQPFSPSTFDKLSQFYTLLDNNAGRAYLSANRVDRMASTAMFHRLEGMLERGGFQDIPVVAYGRTT